MSLPTDIIARIERDFPRSEDEKLVSGILSSLQTNERDRVIRCILFAAAGDVKKIGELESLAKIDYRDVIMAGEYEYPSHKRLRDLSEQFDA